LTEVCFPNSSNQGKYLDYSVLFTDRKKQPAQERRVRLGEILEKSELTNNFSHTVGFFKGSSGEVSKFKPEYMEIRFIGTIEDFWLLLNALNI